MGSTIQVAKGRDTESSDTAICCDGFDQPEDEVDVTRGNECNPVAVFAWYGDSPDARLIRSYFIIFVSNHYSYGR